MKILIVEDDPAAAKILARIFAPLCGASEPAVVYRMEEALALLADGQKYDLISLDLRLPGWEVDQTIAKIHDMRASNPEGLLVVVSGNMDATIEQRVLEAGAHGFIFKPMVAHRESFLDNLVALGKSIMRQPTKYQLNLALAEMLVAKVCEQSQRCALEKVTEAAASGNAGV